MAPKAEKVDDEAGNMLKMLMDQAEDLDMLAETAGVSTSTSDSAATDPKSLIVPGYEISKLFAVIEFAFQHANDASEGSLLEGLGMMTREQAVKAVNGTFAFVVHSPSEAKSAKEPPPKELYYLVDMRRGGTMTKVDKLPAKPKPDVVLRVTDKDMVALATGKMNPQMAFMKGKIKVKGNIMLGLRLNTVLSKEVAKMSRQSKL